MTLIEYELVGEVARVTLTRPEKRNAITHEMVDEFSAAHDHLVEAGATVAVLSGSPPIFSAGNDLVEALAEPDDAAAPRILGILVESPCFWVARITQPALGAGLALAAVCPLSIASTAAWFAMPEREIGIFPAGITPYTEPLIGFRRSFSLGLSGERLSAEEAAQIGLIDEAVPPENLDVRLDFWVKLLTDDSQVTRAAREAWQARFALASARERDAQLNRVLASQEIRVDGNPILNGEKGSK